MVDISRKRYGRNGVKTIVDSDGILSLNEKKIEEGFDHKKLRLTTAKYLSDHGKHRYELVDEPNKQPNRIFIHKELAAKLWLVEQQQHINLEQD